MMFISIVLLSLFIKSYSYSEPHQLYYELSTHQFYLVRNNEYCAIAGDDHNSTVKYLGFNPEKTSYIDSIKKTTWNPNKKLRCPVSLTEYDEDYCSNYHLFCIDKFAILNDNLPIVKSVKPFGIYFNPSIIPFQGKLLMIRRTNKPFLEIMDTRLTNIKRFDGNYDADHPMSIYETDIRIFLKPNGNILLFISRYHHSWCCITEATRELVYNPSTDRYKLTDLTRLVYNEFPTINEKEKNWSPFIYKNEVYLVQKILPLFRVLKLQNSPIYNTTVYHDEIVPTMLLPVYSDSSCNKMKYTSGQSWDYGDIRGGTQAILIPGYGYLSFFHSNKVFCNEGNYSYKSYYMGAYIFSDTVPFKLLKISSQPIMSKDLTYDIKNGVQHGGIVFIIVFPMSYWLEDNTGKIIEGDVTIKPSTVVLSVGYNDETAKIVKLDFDVLIESLTDVNC